MTNPLHPPRDALVDTRTALGSGYRLAKLTAMVRSGRLVRLLRGQYVDAGAFARLAPEDRHCLLVAATVAGMSSPVLVSHYSSLVMIGLPTYGVDLSRVHLTRTVGNRSRSRPGLTVHASYGECASVDYAGIRLAEPTIAALGTAIVSGIEAGVVALDGVLASGLSDDAHIQGWLHRLDRFPGSRRARRAAELADGRSESPGESRTRLILNALDLGPVRPQVEIFDDAGLVGRVDFLLPRLRAVVEFDGMVKYGEDDARAVLIAEKAREDRLRALGFIVIRLVWRDLEVPGRVAAIVRKACGQAGSGAEALARFAQSSDALHR